METPSKKGFSLVKLIIFIVIIGVIAAIAIPRITRKSSTRVEGDEFTHWIATQSMPTAKEILENSDLTVSTTPEIVDESLKLSRAEVENSTKKVWIRVVFPTSLDLKKGDKVGVKIVQTLQPHDSLSWFYFVYKK